MAAAPVADPRLQPTPDYGTLGPGSDGAGSGPITSPGSVRQTANARHFGPVFAIAIGVLLAVLTGNARSAHAAWLRFANLFPVRQSAPASAKDPRQLDRMKPQKQAEALLELAVGHSDGAADQISSRVDRWQGKVKWNPQIATLTTAALNSSDMRVRESGVEVELAAYGLAKNSASLDYLLNSAESSNHAQKIWALWALGLMANRGVESDHVVQVLTAHLKDADDDSRRWAVEGLALSGATQTIEPLLKTMHDDPSPSVRERAACSLAESGMFTREQRLTAVPQLLSYTDDPSLDAQTHGWAFQALGDITRQRLPNDSNAWRTWYDSLKTN
ncbi:MAG: HEAT repeat domain-containing protein [Candidatus Sulfotelmatobacter sp.]